MGGNLHSVKNGRYLYCAALRPALRSSSCGFAIWLPPHAHPTQPARRNAWRLYIFKNRRTWAKLKETTKLAWQWEMVDRWALAG